jgi:enoyl-CoA hydratase/carnithine racemase
MKEDFAMPKTGIRLHRQQHLAVVTLDRPQRRNAFDADMFDELERVTAELEKRLPRAVVITGAGSNAFCAGFDVNPDNPMVAGIMDAVSAHDDGPARTMIARLRQSVDGFIGLPVPLIAALNGIAYGGGAELAVRCDLRVIDPGAIICFSEVRLGLMPDWGGGATLARLIGPSKAADLVLTARQVEAEEALQLGLVNRVSSAGTALDEAISLGEAISRNGPQAVRRALAVIRQSPQMSLDDALDLEAGHAAALIASAECVYGVAAFLEKKAPEFPDIEPYPPTK